MNTSYRIWLVTAVLLAFISDAAAQSRRQVRMAQIDSALVMNNSIFDDDAVVVNQNKWRLRAFFGFRL